MKGKVLTISRTSGNDTLGHRTLRTLGHEQARDVPGPPPDDDDDDGDEAPETPLDEPPPLPVQDPPDQPDPHPYVVRCQRLIGTARLFKQEGLASDNLFSPNFGQPTAFVDPRRAMVSVRLNLGG